MTRQRQLRYQWGRTWPDAERDYLAYDDGETVIGRVYWSVAQQAWVWHAWYDAGGPVEDSRNGWHADKIGACRAMEAAYDGMARRDGR